ncbi:MAG: ATP-binding cassette domain-containing protein, partial [Humibacillus sp.]
MSTTLRIRDLGVAFGARPLFTGLDLTLADGDVTAVVGPNGSGKSTLMRTLVGDRAPESGSIRLSPPGASVAWLPQAVPDPAETLLAYARRRTGVEAADAELEHASAAMASGMPGGSDRYATALERWLSLGAAELDSHLPEVAARVGLGVDVTRPLGSLSGGQAARVSLVTVLLSHHDVLLLDEPTNDLDARGLDLVADFVRSHGGPVLIASHDRSFLDAVATSVVELDPAQQRVAHYTGSWSDYVSARTLDRA